MKKTKFITRTNVYSGNDHNVKENVKTGTIVQCLKLLVLASNIL
jgi:hypothetical protein